MILRGYHRPLARPCHTRSTDGSSLYAGLVALSCVPSGRAAWLGEYRGLPLFCSL